MVVLVVAVVVVVVQLVSMMWCRQCVPVRIEVAVLVGVVVEVSFVIVWLLLRNL